MLVIKQISLWYVFFPQVNTKHINTAWAEPTVVECLTC